MASTATNGLIKKAKCFSLAANYPSRFRNFLGMQVMNNDVVGFSGEQELRPELIAVAKRIALKAIVKMLHGTSRVTGG